MMNKTNTRENKKDTNIKITFNDLCIEWLERKKIKLKHSSYNKYQYLINDYINPELGELILINLDLLIIEERIANIYFISKDKKISTSLMKSILYIINAVLSHGNRLGYFLLGKAIFELPTVEKNHGITILNREEESHLISHFINNKSNNNLGIMISLLTGLRLGEVCALKGEDIDFNTATLYVRSTVQRLNIPTPKSKTRLVVTTPKSKQSCREIPIPAFLMNYMKEYKLNKLNKDYYILTRTKQPYEPRTLQYCFHQTLVKCNIEKKNFHCLRHTFATNCIKSGFDVKTLSEILGHSNVSFTLNRYVHSDLEHKRNQMNKMFHQYKIS